VADEHNIELKQEMGIAGGDKIGAKAGAKEGKTEVNDIEARLNSLKQL